MSLIRMNNVQRYTEGLLGPVILHVTTCEHCPLRMSCFARHSLYDGDYNLAACSRCWCVYFELHPARELHICARLRHGCAERPGVWRSIPSERVRTAIDAPDHRFGKMLAQVEDDLHHPIGCKVFSQRLSALSNWNRGHPGWNPEHPINLSENLREYLVNDRANYYRDDSIEVCNDDCLTMYRRYATRGVLER